MQSRKIPATIVTGFLGSGKTTLLRHLLQNAEGRRIAVIVNEFGELGIDGELLRGCGIGCDETGAPDGQLFELANGCLCCTVQEEFAPVMEQRAATASTIWSSRPPAWRCPSRWCRPSSGRPCATPSRWMP